MIASSIGLALRQLGRNKSRTALTSLGMLIGVAAVICLVALGRGATKRIEGDLQSFGHNPLFVVPGNEGPGGRGSAAPFREEDARALAQIAGVAQVAPIAARPLRAVRGDQGWRTTVYGVTSDWFPAMGWTIEAGRSFVPGELASGAGVCVLGATVVTELFGAQSPLGLDIRVGKLDCRVVGTLGRKGENTFGQDQDDLVVVPLATVQRRITGNRDVATILVSAADGADSQGVQREVEAVMRVRRHVAAGADPDFFVRDMAEAMGIIDRISTILTAFLGAVAAISLLVGGIGIMNIMLVSVTERTREIGIRLAIGATGRDVLNQFLVEAVVLASIGGTAGVIVGIGASMLVARGLHLPLVVDPEVVFLAFAVSATVGIAFGYFPARRAARLDPIEALRHE